MCFLVSLESDVMTEHCNCEIGLYWNVLIKWFRQLKFYVGCITDKIVIVKNVWLYLWGLSFSQYTLYAYLHCIAFIETINKHKKWYFLVFTRKMAIFHYIRLALLDIVSKVTFLINSKGIFFKVNVYKQILYVCSHI